MNFFFVKMKQKKRKYEPFGFDISHNILDSNTDLFDHLTSTNDLTCVFFLISAEEQLMNQNTILIMVVVGLAVVVFLVILYCFQQRQRRHNRGTGFYPYSL